MIHKKIKSIIALFLVALTLVSCDGKNVTIDNDNDVPAHVNKFFEPLQASDKITTNTGTGLDMYIDWSLSSENGKTGKLTLEVGITHRSIEVGERKNLGVLKVGAKSKSFSTDAIKSESDEIQTHKFFTETVTIKADKNGTFEEQISAQWPYKGQYNGEKIDTLAVSGTVKAKARPVSGDDSPSTGLSSEAATGKCVAFTFDDGPHDTRTKLIVDELKKYDAHATFFVVGNRLPSQVKYAYDNGNEIGIHTYTHRKDINYATCSDEIYNEEISKTADAIKKYTGQAPALMRPVGGSISNDRIKSSPYSIINWSIDSEDWKNKREADDVKQENIDTIVSNVMNNVKDGDIVLMHDIYMNTYEAFCIIIRQLYEQGYKVVSVSELIGTANLMPGTLYTNRK